MRILLITSRYLPHRGGLESVAYHLAQVFQKQGHTIQIVTNRYPRTLPAREQIEGIQIIRLHFILPELKYLRAGRFDLWLAGLWYRIHTRRALRRIIKDFQPDIINNHYLNETAEFTEKSIYGIHPAIPWVLSLHGGDVDGEPLLSSANKARFCRLVQKADEVTACSQFLANQAQSLEPALQGKTHVIHNGVDAVRFANAEPHITQFPYIFAVGQLMPHKGFDLLIEAFAKVSEKYPKIQLWIAGAGGQKADLDFLILQKKLTERVRILGKVDEGAVASLMAGSLFIAMPSRREPFGIVALEGMAAGKPVLATPVGGLPEFLPVPPNLLVAPEVDLWAAALDEWLTKPEHGQTIVEKNRKEASKRIWQKTAEQYLQIYKQACKQ